MRLFEVTLCDEFRAMVSSQSLRNKATEAAVLALNDEKFQSGFVGALENALRDKERYARVSGPEIKGVEMEVYQLALDKVCTELQKKYPELKKIICSGAENIITAYTFNAPSTVNEFFAKRATWPGMDMV